METLNHNIMLLMKMIADRGAAMFSSETDLPLTSAQCSVVVYVESCGGGAVSQKSVERHLGISHSTAKGLLQRLEEKGFLRTAFDGEDGRVKNVYLTDKCLQAKKRMRELINSVSEQMLHGITLAERQLLAGLLEHIYDNIKR